MAAREGQSTVFTTFVERAGRYADRPFLRAPESAAADYADGAIEYSYAEALKRVEELRGVYRALDISAGDRVALAFDSRLGVYLHLLALNATGASIVPLNMAGADEELLHVIRHSESRMMGGAMEYLERLRVLATEAGTGVTVFDPSAVEVERIDAPPAGDTATEAALLYTSGTTGKPTGCILSNEYFHALGYAYRALVTGGSAGIGESISRHLLDSGYTVLNLSRRPSGFRHGKLVDATVDLSDVDYIVRLHLQAGIILLQGVLPAMKEAGFGRVVIVGSRAMLGLQTRTGYSATKAGQVGMVRTWALEPGPHGITANVVAPGPIVTDMFTEVIPEDSDRARKLAESIPMRRLGRADDVAKAVMFLVSPDSGFVTGQTLFVFGGTSVGSLSL